jgi:hypothetical protein
VLPDSNACTCSGVESSINLKESFTKFFENDSLSGSIGRKKGILFFFCSQSSAAFFYYNFWGI